MVAWWVFPHAFSFNISFPLVLWRKKWNFHKVLEEKCRSFTKPKQTYFTIKYRLPNRVIKIQFLGGLPTDYIRYGDWDWRAKIKSTLRDEVLVILKELQKVCASSVPRLICYIETWAETTMPPVECIIKRMGAVIKGYVPMLPGAEYLTTVDHILSHVITELQKSHT